LPVAVIISVGTSGLTLSSTITQVFQTRIHDAIVEGYDDWRNIAISLMTMKAVLALFATIFPSKVGLPAAVAFQSLASPTTSAARKLPDSERSRLITSLIVAAAITKTSRLNIT